MKTDQSPNKGTAIYLFEATLAKNCVGRNFTGTEGVFATNSVVEDGLVSGCTLSHVSNDGTSVRLVALT